MSTKKLVCLGEIVAAHGIKGWVKVVTFTGYPEDLVAYGPLIRQDLSPIILQLETLKSATTVLARIEGCITRSQAGTYKGTKLFIYRDQLPPLGEGEYYHEDIIGMMVLDERGQEVGTVEALQNAGAGDFLEVLSAQGSKPITAIFSDDSIIKIDLENRELHIRSSFLLVQKNMTWQATVITLFPQMFPGPLSYSLAGRALKEDLWSLKTVDIRGFAHDKHRTVDDTCVGGGAGMVLKPDIVDAALNHAYSQYTIKKPAIIYLTPRGELLRQPRVHSLIQDNPEGCILLCGRYEGIDDRVIEKWREEKGLIEISIGDYILSGGEVAALVLIDACVRLLRGVVGKQESLDSESFELDLLEFPQYTKPQNWQNRVVPEVLLSGDHKKIAAWRRQQAEKVTQKRRPDLWQVYLDNSSNKQK